jgi:16S rRNA (guanine527-N7)-methyltransferase
MSDGAGEMPHDRLRAAAALDRFGFVTNRIKADLGVFVSLIQRWQRTHNLVGAATLHDLWSRHVADSLQLVSHAPADFHTWVDLGSGAGFPGLVAAIACKADPARRFTLVESNAKKAAFLRAAIRETGAKACVAAERIEAHSQSMRGEADVVSARALAPLPRLFALAHPYLHEASVMLLLKGRDVAHEIESASADWSFDLESSPSVTDPEGRVIVVRRLRRKPG